ncbi:hypothetical protein ACO0K2_04285 [Undibacterium sp. MH2W]|uniref:hypothetical protein n=1 Tax=Undibacterium sp. MH2W TaxID=3413044 RepID=UPI003BF236BA
MDLKKLMPVTARRIDRLRKQMGNDAVNVLLRKAMAGEPGHFFAMENHRTFGALDTSSTSIIGWNEAGQCVRSDPQWMIDAIGFASSIGIEIEVKDDQDHEEARERAKLLRKILREAKYNA